MNALNTQTSVAVIGAGAMGAGIAQVAAQAGHSVLLYDTRECAAAQAISNIDQQLGKRVAAGKLAPDQHAACIARLQPCDSLEGLADCGLIIEAIVENLAVKRELLAALEALCRTDCILASNTSSLSITTLAARLQRPERMAGLHFFNPAPAMALVEVVCGLATSASVAASLYDTAKAWGKKPVHTRSTPGFIVNRVARPFYAESLRLLQEGAADCASLDALMRDAGGFRMGAFELTDLIGHDVNYAVTCSVFDAYYHDMRFQPSLLQKELVDAGRLGRKTGQGFYDYREGTVKTAPARLASASPVEPVVAEGVGAVLKPLLQRFEDRGINVIQRPGSGLLRIGDATLALSDGRLAAQRARDEGLDNLLLLDLALDYACVTGVGLSWAAGCSQSAIDQVVAVLAQAGLHVTPLADTPALLVLRTVAMIANEAADAVLQGVASPADIDLAMCAGVNYPKGPLAWADDLGLATVVHTLHNLQAAYGEARYRPSLLLRRRLPKGEACMNDLTAQQLAERCARALMARDNASLGLGMQLLEAGPGRAHLRMPVRADMLQGHGTCHGGFLFALADSAFAMACNTYNDTTVAQGCSIDYVAPAFEGDVLSAQCSEQSRSGRTGNYDVRIENQQGQLIALFHGKSYKVRGTVLAQETST